MISNGGRRSEIQNSRVARGAVNERGKWNNQVWDLRRKDLQDISLSNAFGRLGEDLDTPKLLEENKENHNTLNQLEEKSAQQGNNIVFGSSMNRDTGGNKHGRKGKKTGGHSGPGGIRPMNPEEKLRTNLSNKTKCGRGIIFIPIQEKLVERE